jgi:AraC-like DNA-binding protein
MDRATSTSVHHACFDSALLPAGAAGRRALVEAVSRGMQRPFQLAVLGPDAAFHYRMDIRLFGSTMIGCLSTSPIEVAIGASESAEDNLVVELVDQGPGFQTEQAGQCFEVGPGEAIISRGALPRRNRTESALRVLILQMPMDRFRALFGAADDLPMRRLPSGTPGLSTLQGYLRSVAESPLEASHAALCGLMATQLRDLCLSLMCIAWPTLAASGPQAHAAAARRIVSMELGEPSLDEALVARRLGISCSYLRKLFADQGGFASYVRQQRLQRAHAMLRDPLQGETRVIEVAHDCGFTDTSTFNRQFRRRFGVTPSQVRAAVPGEPAAPR